MGLTGLEPVTLPHGQQIEATHVQRITNYF